MARTDFRVVAVNPPTPAEAQEMIRVAAPLIARLLSLHSAKRDGESTLTAAVAAACKGPPSKVNRRGRE